MDINIDALYNILKQNQGDVNEPMGYKKKSVMVTSDPLALVIQKTKVSKRKEKVLVQSKFEGSDDEHISDLKKTTTLLVKAFNRKKYYATPTNNNLRTYSAYSLANKKPEYVNSKEKKEDKKSNEKKRDMSKTKTLLAKKDCDEQVFLAEDQAWMESSSDSNQEISANMVFMAKMENVLSDSDESLSFAKKTLLRKKIDEQKILFDKMSRQLVKKNNNVLRLQEKILEKQTKISELEECVLKIQVICKELRPSLYDERVIGLRHTLMFLTHSDEALEIKKFKRERENKIEFAYDYGNLNASYVNEKIKFSDDYFQEIINLDFEKIDSSFQQTSSLKPYVLTVILEKIIIDLEDKVIVQICLWIINSGCSKHMTGNCTLLTNLMEKFIGTVRFGNNDFAMIAGYGDVVIGSMTIKKVYYVEDIIDMINDQDSVYTIPPTSPPDYPLISYLSGRGMKSLKSESVPKKPNEMAPKRTSTSTAPAMNQAAIRKLVADSVSTTLEAQAATMANTDNTNRNTEQRETYRKPTGYVGKQMWIFSTNFIFAFPRIFWSSFRVPSDFDYRNMTLSYLQVLSNLHDLFGCFMDYFWSCKSVHTFCFLSRDEMRRLDSTPDCARSCVMYGTSLTQWTVSSISTVLSWSSSIGSESFWPSILLLTKIIRAIVTDVLVVVALPLEFKYLRAALLEFNSHLVVVLLDYYSTFIVSFYTIFYSFDAIKSNSFRRKNSGDSDGDLIVGCGSYEHYESVGAEVELLEPGFELDDQEWVEMGSFLFVRLEMRSRGFKASIFLLIIVLGTY
nr:integrase, catalytic region, zinc finger, CCHC-type, peptidase aspartic, catalytic [Tanacetum cinerariifolium]